MKDFHNLKIWEKGHKNALFIYKETKGFPKEEQFGLISQLRRAAVSIPTNIAEGCGRNSEKEFANFLQISMGSACEIEYLIFLSYELEFISAEIQMNLTENILEIKRMLATLINKIRKN